MKTIKIAAFGIIMFILMTAMGCRDVTPRDNLDKYISSWQKSDFTSMYSILSTESRQQINETDFIKQHRTVYDEIKAANVKITPTYPEKFAPDKNGEITIPLNVTMDTTAGSIQFSGTAVLVKEKVEGEKNWFIKWNEDMIYPGLAQGNTLKAKEIAAKRGELFDRNGNGLAVNASASLVGIVPEKLTGDKNTAIAEIAKLLDMTPGQITKKLGASWVKPNLFVPVNEIPVTQWYLKEELLKIPGIKITETASRTYPCGEAAAHLIGYIDPSTGDGKTGLEKIYNDRLRGKSGYDIYLVNSSGETQKIIAQKKPQDGEKIRLTIDSILQRSIYNELKNDAGTGIAMNPKTGEVLAMVSTPSYDPNLCVLGYPASKWQALTTDPNKPFLNRFAGVYAPGSTFKAVTASLGISKGTLIPDNIVTIEGEKWQPSPNWGKDFITRVDTNVTKLDLNKALIFSDNIYFAQAALNVGIKDFIDGAGKFGIGEDIPFPYPLKASQIGNNNKITSSRQLADTAYGQAQVLMNPLQLGLIYSTFLNEGNIPVPLLEKDSKEETWKEGVIPSEAASRVLQGLVEVVNNPSGPCYKDARIPGVTIAGKTGTAELNSSSNAKDEKQLGWFVGFNTTDPQLLVVMMAENVQNRGESHYVVPKVRNVIQRYLKTVQGK